MTQSALALLGQQKVLNSLRTLGLALAILLIAAIVQSQRSAFLSPENMLTLVRSMVALGMLAFALVWLRLAARLSGPAPAIHPGLPGLQRLSSRLLHLALYVLMIGMPLTGWLVLSAAGKPVPFFGLELPALIGENKALAKQIKQLHETVGTMGYVLIGLHVVAALHHHYIKRDDTLLRMLPGRD